MVLDMESSTTTEIWVERVAAWRASGERAETFSRRGGYAVERHIDIFGAPPILASTDRGFYSGAGVKRLEELGVRRVVVPFPGKRSQKRMRHEKQRWFRRGRAWRAGGEARISRLKYRFGMARSAYRGPSGTARTVYWAGIANNLVAIAAAA
jgi:IS5 family transposase